MLMDDYFSGHGSSLTELVQRLSGSRRIQMVISVKDLESLPRFVIETAIMKAAIYSETVIVVFPALHRLEEDGVVHATTDVTDIVSPSPVIQDLVGDLRSEPGVYFVPESLRLDEEGFDGTGYGSWSRSLFFFDSVYRNPWGLEVDLRSTVLRSNFGEIERTGVDL